MVNTRDAKVLAIAAVSMACVFDVRAAVIIETVTVGDPGNAGELSGEAAGGGGPTRICGGVGYNYNIGKFEVTAGQYAAFLNAVAATDAFGLYNPLMVSAANGCQITQVGEAGRHTYDFSGRPSGTETDWANRPVNYVSWGDAARFANWLHNGQPIGAQVFTTTEDGSYYLNGAIHYPDLLAVTRRHDATWVIPSEDEWHKAAYYDGGNGVYYDYATSSNDPPSNDLIDPDPGNNATFQISDFTIGSPYWRTEVGAHENSSSHYGTFDQFGNVWEWNEEVLTDKGPFRGLRGGSFFSFDYALPADCLSSYVPSADAATIGFRVAEVPVPGAADFDGDGDADLFDFASFQAQFAGDLFDFAVFEARFTGPQ